MLIELEWPCIEQKNNCLHKFCNIAKDTFIVLFFRFPGNCEKYQIYTKCLKYIKHLKYISSSSEIYKIDPIWYINIRNGNTGMAGHYARF